MVTIYVGRYIPSTTYPQVRTYLPMYMYQPLGLPKRDNDISKLVTGPTRIIPARGPLPTLFNWSKSSLFGCDCDCAMSYDLYFSAIVHLFATSDRHSIRI